MRERTALMVDSDPIRLCVGCFQEETEGISCPGCGYDESVERLPLFLPLRTPLQQYVVGRELGRPGGFGITYLAFDQGLRERVAIKEYLPKHLAGRYVNRLAVLAHSTKDEDFFRFGLDQFNLEAQTLARFRHPHIVRVRSFFQANGTAYMVMDYYPGETLEAYLERHGGRILESEAVALIEPILEALSSEVHAQRYLHRDISPQNIYLASRSGVCPLLLDFGAARVALGNRSQSLSVVLKPGYAPLEQYATTGRQGDWTDVYGCAATLYRTVTGQAPPPAVDRATDDELVPADELVPGLSRELCEALEWGLEVHYQNRPQTVDEFRERLRPTPRRPSPPLERPEPPAPPPAPGVGVPVLRLLSGEEAGEEIPLDDTLVIGREAALCNVVRRRGDLSRQHCAVRYDRGRGVFQIEDLGSTNGTFVERGEADQTAQPLQEVTLNPGDRFFLVDRDELFEVALVAEASPDDEAEEPEPKNEAPSGPQPEADVREPLPEPRQPTPLAVRKRPRRRIPLGWVLFWLLVGGAALAAFLLWMGDGALFAGEPGPSRPAGVKPVDQVSQAVAAREVDALLLAALDHVQQEDEDGAQRQRHQRGVEGQPKVAEHRPEFAALGVDCRQPARDAQHRADEAEGGDRPHHVADHRVAHLHPVGDELQAAVQYADRLVDRAAGLELQDAEVDQGGQEAVVAVEVTDHPAADRRQVVALEHRLVVLRQELLVQEPVLPLGNAPAQEDLAEADAEEQEHDRLDGQRIGRALPVEQDHAELRALEGEREQRDDHDGGGHRGAEDRPPIGQAGEVFPGAHPPHTPQRAPAGLGEPHAGQRTRRSCRTQGSPGPGRGWDSASLSRSGPPEKSGNLSRTASSSSFTERTRSPKRTVSVGEREVWRTGISRSPATIAVPLAEWQSVRKSLPPSMKLSSAWWRLTESSASTMSQSRARPMRNVLSFVFFISVSPRVCPAVPAIIPRRPGPRNERAGRVTVRGDCRRAESGKIG